VRQVVVLRLMVIVFLAVATAAAQSTNGTISGIVLDPAGKAIPAADIEIVNDATGVRYAGRTNSEGIYAVPDLPPGPYRLQVSKTGFKTLIKPDIVLNVQDALAINFTLPIGALSEVVTIEGGAPLINTESAAVSTVVDRQFAENLPLNGRSFQTLINLAPGVVLTPSNYGDNGQFSVNGQRAASNYWMVDGVSANIGIGVNSTGYPGNGLGGGLGSFSAMGGTNSLVSVDALEEFRIQTSTYAPEFGRTPGGQISIVTRSGTNDFHGTLFDYLRNDALDANDWFANFNHLPKPEERQNDFGGTFGGPIWRDETFFFFSYEGLRLRLPEVLETTVPDLSARRQALPALAPYLNTFPLPNGTDSVATGIAQFNASFSNSSSLDAFSLRIDQKLPKSISLFGRYAYSPSNITARGDGGSLNTVSPTRILTETGTAGGVWTPTSSISNDLRFNYSRVHASVHSYLDGFGGANVPSDLPFPSPFTSNNGLFLFYIFSLQQGYWEDGHVSENLQRQLNIVDGLSLQKGSHGLKFGVDFRRLTPIYQPAQYEQAPLFADVASAANGQLLESFTESNLNPTLLLRNLGLYAEDLWRVTPHLTMTYGIRWDIDFSPGSLSGPNFAAVANFDLTDLSQLAVAPLGTLPYHTSYRGFAPRIGAAYTHQQSQDREVTLRGGFGVFYDLISSELGTQIGASHYPFGASNYNIGGTFPLTAAAAAPPTIAAPTDANRGVLYGFDPHLQLPYTLEWNVALEQALGKQQSFSVSYVGAAGKRLLQTVGIVQPNPNLYAAQLLVGDGTSDYDALQAQFQRRLSHNLQVLASYTWSHSIDTGSAGSGALASNALIPSAAESNRGPSDFDIRNTFSAASTYAFPTLEHSAVARDVLGYWSTENIVLVRSAPPVDVSDALFSQFSNGFTGDVRPDVVAGQSLYLYGSQYPGGKAFNPAAFTSPPIDPSTQLPLRQGNLGRNALRGFGAAQWDLAIHREFPLHEPISLQFRAELFNVLNHPNFGPPSGAFGEGGFGVATQMLGQSLDAQNLGGGAFSPLYQIGGPRSIQLALKLNF